MQMFVFNKLLFDRFLKNQIISRILLIKHFSRIFSVSNFRCELSTPGKWSVSLPSDLVKALKNWIDSLEKTFQTESLRISCRPNYKTNIKQIIKNNPKVRNEHLVRTLWKSFNHSAEQIVSVPSVLYHHKIIPKFTWILPQLYSSSHSPVLKSTFRLLEGSFKAPEARWIKQKIYSINRKCFKMIV